MAEKPPQLGCIVHRNPAEKTWDCPCHGSRFDLAGRVFQGSPASVNLRIPPYEFPSPLKLVVGVDETHQGAA